MSGISARLKRLHSAVEKELINITPPFKSARTCETNFSAHHHSTRLQARRQMADFPERILPPWDLVGFPPPPHEGHTDQHTTHGSRR
eukprot:4814443-Prymnesium_polylepis.1